MIKKIKFNLDIGGYALKSIEDVREHFHCFDILKNFEDGRLSRWLVCRGFKEELHAVEAIDRLLDKKDIVLKLAELFNVTNLNVNLIDKMLNQPSTEANNEDKRNEIIKIIQILNNYKYVLHNNIITTLKSVICKFS